MYPCAMQRWRSLTLVVLLGCGGDDGGSTPGDGGSGSGSGSGSTGEPAELMGIVAAHNAVRHMVDTPTPLPDLVWDDGLAATARAWVAMCRDSEAPTGLIDHNPGRGTNVGENVFGSSGTATAQGAVSSWAAEKANYTYATNSCNGVCGHYTQIVWRATTKVGCAVATCAGLQFGGTLVCDYSPAGNFSGQKPY